MRFFAKATAAAVLTVLATTGCSIEVDTTTLEDAFESTQNDRVEYGSDYDRDAFGSAWEDVDQNGCSTRDDILARDLDNLVIDGDDCTVLFGTLQDPYTGTVIEFERGHSAVDIDHVFPLSASWEAGADEWTEGLRTAFANDPENLYAASAFNIELPNGTELRGNRSKGDSTLSEWMPDNVEFHCEYATQYMTVARKYSLTVSKADARVAAQAC